MYKTVGLRYIPQIDMGSSWDNLLENYSILFTISYTEYVTQFYRLKPDCSPRLLLLTLINIVHTDIKDTDRFPID